MRGSSAILLTIFLANFPRPLLAKVSASHEDSIPPKLAKAGLLAAPRPVYPYAARVARAQGKGVYLVSFDPESGLAREATTVHSTGYAMLDEAAIDAFHKWRVKAHTFKKLEVPFTFQITGEEAARVRGSDPNILYGPPPRFPTVAAGLGVNPGYPSRGRFQLNIDPSNGLVTDVKILESTGHWDFDTAAVRAFRQWRFCPHTLTEYIVPLGTERFSSGNHGG